MLDFIPSNARPAVDELCNGFSYSGSEHLFAHANFNCLRVSLNVTQDYIAYRREANLKFGPSAPQPGGCSNFPLWPTPATSWNSEAPEAQPILGLPFFDNQRAWATHAENQIRVLSQFAVALDTLQSTIRVEQEKIARQKEAMNLVRDCFPKSQLPYLKTSDLFQIRSTAYLSNEDTKLCNFSYSARDNMGENGSQAWQTFLQYLMSSVTNLSGPDELKESRRRTIAADPSLRWLVSRALVRMNMGIPNESWLLPVDCRALGGDDAGTPSGTFDATLRAARRSNDLTKVTVPHLALAEVPVNQILGEFIVAYDPTRVITPSNAITYQWLGQPYPGWGIMALDLLLPHEAEQGLSPEVLAQRKDEYRTTLSAFESASQPGIVDRLIGGSC